MNRRDFLINAAVAGGGLAFSGLLERAEVFAQTGNLESLTAKGYGELAPVAAKNTGETLLALPKGFEYNVLGKVKTVMKDGRPTPRAHDGMATFHLNGEIRLVRNHEINDKIGKENVAIGASNHYDESAGGGTTTLVVNQKTNELTRDFVSLSGTLNNCAGGATPWGSWITCEESTFGTTKFERDGKQYGGFLQPHGYCFEVPASANSIVKPEPLKAMGRFVHEAIAIDAKTGIVYLTEDNNPAGFYRFLPVKNKRLSMGGELQILVVKDKPNFDTRKNLKNGMSFAATWAKIENPDPAEADTDSSILFKTAAEKSGAATFGRLEGCFAAAKNRIYFVSTSGGDNNGGQIFLYEPVGRNEGRVTLVFESPDRNMLDMPDNICFQPKTNLLFVCEDSDYGSPGITPENNVRILTPNGKIANFARNIAPGKEATEFAGSTFSKDGKTLFLNLQAVGATCAIWGDWKNFVS